MNLLKLLYDSSENAVKMTKENASAVLTGIGVAGILGTVALTALATKKAIDISEKLELKKQDLDESYDAGDVDKEYYDNCKKSLYMDAAKKYVVTFLPVAVTCGASITCFIKSYKISSKKIAAITAAYTITDTAFKEYKDKVVEKIGKKKEEEIRDDICKDKIDKKPYSQNPALYAGGEMLFYDPFLERYFTSTVDKVMNAVAEINDRMTTGNEMYATLNDFYYEADIKRSDIGEDIGWCVGNPLKIRFSSHLTDNMVPCMCIEYENLPTATNIKQWRV